MFKTKSKTIAALCLVGFALAVVAGALGSGPAMWAAGIAGALCFVAAIAYPVLTR